MYGSEKSTRAGKRRKERRLNVAFAGAILALAVWGCGNNGKTDGYGKAAGYEDAGMDVEVGGEEAVDEDMALDRQEEDLQTASGKAAEVYRDIYERAVQENALGSLETTKAIVDRMGEYGYCAIDQENKNQVNLTHPELIKEWIGLAEEGKDGRQTIFSIMDDGGFIRFDLESEKGTIFVTRSVLHWKGGMPEVDYTERYPAGEWKYSQNGYLFFRKEVPAGYDGSQGYTAIRVEPLDEKCREWNRKYILPIGYGANDMFLEDWTEGEWEVLDFDDLFAKLYSCAYGVPIPYEQSVDGTSYLVPEKEYETVIQSYFSIDKKALRIRQGYVEEKEAYEYRTRGFYDCASSPNIPYPEVVSYEENEDGTVCLTVNAVWPKENMERAFCHEVTVRPMENGGFRYISNRVIPSDENAEPTWYVEKLAYFDTNTTPKASGPICAPIVAPTWSLWLTS